MWYCCFEKGKMKCNKLEGILFFWRKIERKEFVEDRPKEREIWVHQKINFWVFYRCFTMDLTHDVEERVCGRFLLREFLASLSWVKRNEL